MNPIVRAAAEREATSSARDVRAMFTRIAGRYDLMNTLMTAGRHHAWRRLVAQAVRQAPPGRVLDLATGTADLALAIQAGDSTRVIVGADFSEGMLRQARPKLAAHRTTRIVLLAADALALPFADKTFACVSSAFLLRNLAHLGRGLEEMRRVLRPGGRLVALDIVRPAPPWWGAVFGLYFHRIVPTLGAFVAGDRRAYTYLPQSVDRFVTPAELARTMTQAGLHDVTYRSLGLGTVALHVGVA